MAQNKVQFQKGMSLPDFLKLYGTEEQCFNALFDWRWPNGFVCPECGSTKSCQLATRKLQQCNGCRRQTSITADTIFSSTKLPGILAHLDHPFRFCLITYSASA